VVSVPAPRPIPIFPRVSAAEFPFVDAATIVAADDLALGPFGIALLQMMELAGAALADVVATLAPEARVSVLVGSGNNGAGGLCAARHLVNRGHEVSIVQAADRMSSAGEHQRRTLTTMGVPFVDDIDEDALVVDALVGYAVRGPLRGRYQDLARQAAGHEIVSLDVPSGAGFDGAVRPGAVVALALPKAICDRPPRLFVADLGWPRALWRELGIDVGDLFREGRVVEVVG
jgi:NAD(P)H-hydrate epimerase